MSESPVPYATAVGSVPVMQCPIAGFQFHGGEACWSRIGQGDALALRREPGNRHDARAIIVEWQGVMLGYVPREANYALSQMIDRGERVEGRVRSLRAGCDPWQRVMVDVVWIPAGVLNRAPQKPPAEAPGFDPPELLIRSLANRVFGSPPPPSALEWVAPRAAALALVGVEHPAVLPFLRLVEANKSAARWTDPLAALHDLLQGAGIEPGAWKRLAWWGFRSFTPLGADWLKPVGVARLANLLLRLEVVSPPPPEFAIVALAVWRHRSRPGAPLDFERYPLWFMRAVLKALEQASPPDQRAGMVADVRCALDWLIDAGPSLDANQQNAGWKWVVGQARAFKKARALASAEHWRAPTRELTFGNWWVVPITSPAELAEEAAAMKNCLEDYEDDCRTDDFAVYSIRDALTAERHACFAVGRESHEEPWEIEQVAGKANAKAGEEMCSVAEMALAKIRAMAPLSASSTSTP